MASKTDLAGYLRNGEESVLSQMETWLVTGDPALQDHPPKLPAKIRLLYRAPGAQSEETLHEVAIQALPASASNIVDAIEGVIVKKLGATPIGRIRIRGWGQGSASNPGLDITRTLAAGEETGDLANLRSELVRRDREVRELREQNTQFGLGAQKMAVDLAGHLAALSYTRANGSAVADMGGFSGLIGGVVLLILKPHIEASLRGEDGPLRQVGDRLLGLLIPNQAGQPSKQIPSADDVIKVIGDPKARAELADSLEGKVPGIRGMLEAAAQNVAPAPASPELAESPRPAPRPPSTTMPQQET